ncbi:MAG TPA: ComEA family DNA-binding protein [Dehalococcoidia bacterium]|nr:ComEA family DNA-binding protein [Dehalococcoidia bacterium]
MLAWLNRNQLPLLALAGLLLLSAVSYSQTREHTPPALVFRDDSPLAEGTPIRVHVAGAVAAPGVYELKSGDRIAEALAAAGGPIDAADLDALNLARRVRDEEQVVVPRRSGGGPRAEVLAAGAKVDINAASESMLDQLPGIGEAYARRIVDSRKVDGPFKSTQELVDRRVLPRATYERIRELVVVATP